MILKEGRRVKNNGESLTRWWLMDASQTDEEICDELDQHGVEIHGRQIHSAHDCTGKWLGEEINIKRGQFKVLVTQDWSLDI